jgi:dihydrofolate reductase
MRDPRVRVYLGCSLDGCIAGPEHDISFLSDYGPSPGDPPVPSEQAGLDFDAFLAETGALLMGRRTYQVLLDHDVWPYGDRPVLVATHHALPPAPQGGHARAVCGPVEALVAAAREAAGGRDVYVDGGDLVRQALEAGLVDTLCLTFLPVVLGRGIRLWDGLSGRTELAFAPPRRLAGGMVQVIATVRR